MKNPNSGKKYAKVLKVVASERQDWGDLFSFSQIFICHKFIAQLNLTFELVLKVQTDTGSKARSIATLLVHLGKLYTYIT